MFAKTTKSLLALLTAILLAAPAALAEAAPAAAPPPDAPAEVVPTAVEVAPSAAEAAPTPAEAAPKKEPPTAEQLLDAMDEVLNYETRTSRVSMTVDDGRRKREYRMVTFGSP